MNDQYREQGLSSEDIKTLKEGENKLDSLYNVWSGNLGKYSIESSYAIIAANWATHTGSISILENYWALFSIAVCIFLISINIFITGRITRLIKHRLKKAIDRDDDWIVDFRNMSANKYDSEWPYTVQIEKLSTLLQFIKIIAPIIAGASFIKSLIML